MAKLKLMREVFLGEKENKSTGFALNIEKETVKNTDYRRVLYTTEHSQLVLMCIQPGDDIGEEIHQVTQFIRVDKGNGTSIINGEERAFGNGDAIIVPPGCKHNIINSGSTSLKLYTVYSPPQHLKDTVHKTKADDKEDQFDGKIDK